MDFELSRNRELMLVTRDSDVDAFAALVQRHRPRLRRMCAVLSRDDTSTRAKLKRTAGWVPG